LQTRFSRGERTLFGGDGNLDRDNGVNAFSQKNYQDAIEDFTKAVKTGRNDPEPQIYLNNALAQKQGTPYMLAVVVPIESRVDVAKEILRGAADAQEQFNQKGEKGDRLLELLIVNDGNAPQIARQIAAELVKQPSVLGVVGHNSSEASGAALPEYQKAGLVMISPTSTSTALKGDTFFRTVPSDRAAGEQLAKHVTTTLKQQQVVIFYDSTDSYSKSLKDSFEQSFIGKTVVPLVDLAEDADPKVALEKVKASAPQVQVAMLFPGTQTVPRAIAVARENAALPEKQRLRLLGGDVLYDNRTLINGGSAIKDLVLAVPWFANSSYAQTANDRWGGRINWRTASAFDATKALTQTLKTEVTRQQVLAGLRSLKLTDAETSGNPLEFEPSGDRVEEPILVQAIEGGNRPRGAQFGFEQVTLP